MAQPGYIFGGNTGETPQSLAQKRALVAQIMGQSSAPRTLGEGFSAIGDGIVANVTGRRADEVQKGGDADVQKFIDMFMGGPGGTVATGGATGIGAEAAGGPNTYRDAIASIESAGSGDYGAIGPTNDKLGRALVV